MNVLITGISKGLGQELAHAYANNGHTVYGVSRTTPQNAHRLIRWKSADIAGTQAGNTITELLSDCGSLDLLINNAGCGSSGFELADVDAVIVRSQIDIHCIGALAVSKAALPYLLSAPKPKIINVTSRLGSAARHLRGDFEDRSFSYAYRIAKSAQNMLTLCMQGDASLAPVIVAALNPGLLQTDSGSNDADHSAAEGARQFLKTVDMIKQNGVYHAFGEDPTI